LPLALILLQPAADALVSAQACGNVFTFCLSDHLDCPTVLLTDTLIDGLRNAGDKIRDGSLSIPPPPENLGKLLFIGEPLAKFWLLASENIQSALQQLTPVLKVIGSWLLPAATGAACDFAFCGRHHYCRILLANSSGGNRTARAITHRLAMTKALISPTWQKQQYAAWPTAILGVALIQSLLAGLGLWWQGYRQPSLGAALSDFIHSQIGIARS